MKEPSNDSAPVVLIVGATGGIGERVTRNCVERGFKVIAVTSKESGVEELGRRYPGSEIWALALDLMDAGTIDEFAREIESRQLPIDWIVVCSGFISTDDDSMEKIQKTIGVNLIGPILLSHCLKHGLTGKGGVIAISSTASLKGNPRFPYYSAAKAGLNIFMEALSKSWGEAEKRAITIIPGGTNTAMREYVAGDAGSQQSPQIVADVVDEVISDRERYPNGSRVIVVNGKVDIERLDQF